MKLVLILLVSIILIGCKESGEPEFWATDIYPTTDTLVLGSSCSAPNFPSAGNPDDYEAVIWWVDTGSSFTLIHNLTDIPSTCTGIRAGQSTDDDSLSPILHVRYYQWANPQRIEVNVIELGGKQ